MNRKRIAKAASLAALVNAGLLLARLYTLRVYRPQGGFRAFLLRVLLANLALGAWLCLATGRAWTDLSASDRLIRLAGWIGAGMIAYALTLALTGLRPRHLMLAKGA